MAIVFRVLWNELMEINKKEKREKSFWMHSVNGLVRIFVDSFGLYPFYPIVISIKWHLFAQFDENAISFYVFIPKMNNKHHKRAHKSIWERYAGIQVDNYLLLLFNVHSIWNNELCGMFTLQTFGYLMINLHQPILCNSQELRENFAVLKKNTIFKRKIIIQKWWSNNISIA